MVDFCQLDNGAGGLANGRGVFPDFGSGKVYSTFDPSSSGKLLENSLADGSLSNSSSIATVLGVSGNTKLWDYSAAYLNGFLYCVSTNDSGVGNIKLSKINVSTLAETAQLTLTLFGVGGISHDQFNIIPATIGGSDYLAIGLNYSANNPNFEIVNATTMTSVATGQYPHGTFAMYMVSGGVIGTVATFWIIVWGAGDQLHLVNTTFDTSGSVLTFTTIGSPIGPTAIDADADYFNDLSYMTYDVSDSNVMLFAEVHDTSLGNIQFLFKIDTSDASLSWIRGLATFTVSEAYNTSSNSVLTGGRLGFNDNIGQFHEIDTSDGTDAALYHQQHFYNAAAPFLWNAPNGVYLFFDPGDYNDDSGWSIWRPDDASGERWKFAPGGFVPFAGWRDQGGTDPIFSVIQSPAGFNAQSDSGYQLVKKASTDGSIIQAGAVLEYGDAASPFNSEVSVSSSGSVNCVLAGANGIDKLYTTTMYQIAGASFKSAILEFDRTTLTFTQSLLNQASGANYTGNSGGALGTAVRGGVFRALSPDGTFLVSGVDRSYNDPGAIVWQAIEIWCPGTGEYAYIYLNDIGIGVTDRANPRAVGFVSSTDFFIVTQPVAGGTTQPTTGTSTLWRLSIGGGGLVTPTLTIVDSYAIPDGFFAFAGSFASTFSYNGITFNPDTDKLYLWSSALDSGTRYNWSMEFDVVGETFASELQMVGSEIGPILATTRLGWNTADRYPVAVNNGGALTVYDVDTAAQTVDTLVNSSEWEIPYLPNNGFPYIDTGTGNYLNTGSDAVEWSDIQGYLDIVLLPESSVTPVVLSGTVTTNLAAGPVSPLYSINLEGKNTLQLKALAAPVESVVLRAIQGRVAMMLMSPRATLAPPPFPPTPHDFDCLVTVISQYSNSPILLKLLEDFCEYIDPTVDIDAFFSVMWNVDTAQGYGLDVWGRIVGVVRTLEISQIGDFFGFEEAGDADPFDQAPFYNGPTSTANFYLSDTAFRTLIFAKALANISDGSIPAINQLLINLFGADGNVYVTDGNDMTMTYTFSFAPSPVQLAIVSQSGVLPKPVGVLATVVVPP